MSLARKITVGVFWSFVEQLIKRGVGLFVVLLLAKFLLPEDFGLIAMISVFLALGQSLMDSGFRQALIRLPDIDEKDFSTAFFANIIFGIFAYAVLYISAPTISDFYAEPRLILLIRVSSLAVLINAFKVVQVAGLSRDLSFKLLMQASVPASFVSGSVAVVLAYYGFGVWALIVQSLLAALFQTLILWWLYSWRPSKCFCLTSLNKMYRFGYKLFLSQSLEIIFRNIYPLVIAKLFTAPIAGLYFFADKIRELVVSQLLQSVQAVTFPALAKKQKNKADLKKGYRKVIKIISAIYVPLVAGLILTSPSLFEVLFSEKWYPAHRYLQILCFAALIRPIHSLNLNILRVLGRSDILLTLQVFKKVFTAIVLIVTAHISVDAVLWGQVFQSVILYFPNKYYSDRLIGYSFVEQLKDVGLYYVASGVALISVFGILAKLDLAPLGTLVVSLSLLLTFYLPIVFFMDKPLVFDIVKILKNEKYSV